MPGVSDEMAHEETRQRDFATARLRCQQILPFLREEKDKRGIQRVLNVLGVIARAEGNYAEAKGYFAESLETARDLGSGIFAPASNLASVLMHEGEIERASALIVECMKWAQQSGSNLWLSYAIQSYASLWRWQKGKPIEP